MAQHFMLERGQAGAGRIGAQQTRILAQQALRDARQGFAGDTTRARRWPGAGPAATAGRQRVELGHSVLQRGQHVVLDAGRRGRRRGLRRGARLSQRLPVRDVHAGLVARLRIALVFQQPVAARGGGDADALRGGQFAHGGQAVAHAILLGADCCLDMVGQYGITVLHDRSGMENLCSIAQAWSVAPGRMATAHHAVHATLCRNSPPCTQIISPWPATSTVSATPARPTPTWPPCPN